MPQGYTVKAPGYTLALVAPTTCTLALDSLAFGQKREVVLKVAPAIGADPVSSAQVSPRPEPQPPAPNHKP